MKKQLLIALTVFFAGLSNGSKAQILSFEDGEISSIFSSETGKLAISDSKSKLGNKSLAWTWQAGSVLTLTNPTGLEEASKTRDGGIYLWIYNTVPSSSKLVFSFSDKSDLVKCKIDFNLNFKGWRCLLAAFGRDMGNAKSTLVKMTVQVVDGKNYLLQLKKQL